ncbi:diguanylate cyclase (GGDEF) domain-containing protein [Pseudobutyrivibrio sp. YE44]|uniref:diguanylate cyclase n=1 Tax=Pseudobutyrivibrio sp. YE44 TaxID=1520802 RepID=UPI0008858A2D|nr:GGDEF domain-containing protein [Pseudobutyrivibrio sp. YE44]SDB12592.1 diguanylate cyclase (GGDEF) domain-containing protein [Pseudobutyrivibrio sp. YE44]
MINGKKIVALCAYRVYDSQVFSFITELNKLLEDQNCAIFIYAINSEIGNGGDIVPEVAVFDLIPYDKVDAVVIMDEKIKSREVVQGIIDKANSKDVPSVIIDGVYDNASLVRFDYSKGFEAVVRHVIERHNVTRPHFMAGKRDSEFSNDRIKVFKKVIAENGISYDDSMLSYGDFWSVPARAAAEELLNRKELPEAVICANDIMAINVADVFQADGVEIPGDCIVSGFDGMDEAFWAKPGITTAKCDSIELAKTIAEVVFALFKGKRNLKKWIIPTFIANDSCGCPRCNQDLLSAISGLNNRFYHHQDDIHIMQTYTSKIIGGQTPEETLKYIRNPLTDNMCIVVEHSCFDLEKNFLLEDVEPGEKVVIYDSYIEEDRISHYNPEEIIPHLDDVMELGYPLVFNCLEYMGKAPGFVCYTYPRFDLVDYSKTPSITNFFGMALGGYVINRYQKHLRDKLQEMYQHDALTGLFNRLAFRAKIEEMRLDPAYEGMQLTILMADLNGLKQINDTLGHSCGDKAIATVAKGLTTYCPKDALGVRFGGDEMMEFIFGDCNPKAIIQQVDDFLTKESEALGFKVAASIGTHITTFTNDIDMHKILVEADEKMYETKRARKEKS